MKDFAALSFWQPYAWLIINGHTEVDSRTWAPPEKRLGDRIAIHASKRKVTRQGYQEFRQMMKDLKIKDFPQGPEDFDYGVIVGTVQLKSVSKNSKSYFAAPGYFHWLFQDPIKIQPLPVKGHRGWFTVTLP